VSIWKKTTSHALTIYTGVQFTPQLKNKRLCLVILSYLQDLALKAFPAKTASF
jgi:hypothetical protein